MAGVGEAPAKAAGGAGSAVDWGTVTPTRGALLCCLLVLVAACGPSDEQVEADTESIRAALETYLPLLGEAYSTGDLEPLRPYVAEKEVAAIEKRIRELYAQGRVLEPVFRNVTVEDVTVFNRANAYVTTVEVWDLRSLAPGSREVLAEEIEQSNRVKYQLKRDGDGWRVLFRTIQE